MNNKPALRLFLALLLGGTTLAACQKSEEPPLAGARIGGPFTLTDQDGKQVSDSAFNGKYRLIYFGYTYCPDVCPVDVQTLVAGLKLLEKSDPARASKIQPLFITIDPARDTPPILKQFVVAFHPRLIGLTGSEAQIGAVAKEFVVYYKKQPAAAGATGYLMDHARQAMLMGPKGEPLALIPQDEGPEAVARELARWTS